MNDSAHYAFLLPHDMKLERLVRLLGGEDRCGTDGSATFELTFFDSFDWRLHGAGLRLLRIATPQGAVLRLKKSDGSEAVDAVASPDPPAWPAALPDSELRTVVAGLLEMRVLLPLVRVHCEVQDLAYRNEDAKTVVRLQLLSLQCDSPDITESRTLWPRIRLLPVRGYEDERDVLARRLGDELEWPQAPDCLFDEAITAIGREPGDYSSKLDVALRPEAMAVDALRKILLHLLDTLERNVPGAHAGLDSEFLHDLRVATRRTRSALSQVKRVLPDTIVNDFRERFGWLGQVTGETRDLDVFLLELPRYRASLPADMAGDLTALEHHLTSVHAAAQQQLAAELDSERLHDLLADWRAVLEADDLPGEAGWFADLPIERVASRRIWRMYKAVRKVGRAVLDDGRPEDLHELRKDCKKLRYLIEFFRRLYPEDDLKGVIRALKDLLDNLGEFQDLHVQAGRLRGYARDLDGQDADNLATVLAIGALIADLGRRQEAVRAAFAKRFKAFDAKDNRELYKRLFKAKGLPPA